MLNSGVTPAQVKHNAYVLCVSLRFHLCRVKTQERLITYPSVVLYIFVILLSLKVIKVDSLEQNSGCSCRQAFIHYCGPDELHFVFLL